MTDRTHVKPKQDQGGRITERDREINKKRGS